MFRYVILHLVASFYFCSVHLFRFCGEELELIASLSKHTPK